MLSPTKKGAGAWGTVQWQGVCLVHITFWVGVPTLLPFKKQNDGWACAVVWMTLDNSSATQKKLFTNDCMLQDSTERATQLSG